jgi:multicomponent Na+:H+ antiporter subunit E
VSRVVSLVAVAAGLVVVWMGLWGDVSLGNAAGGTIAAIAVLALTRPLWPAPGRTMAPVAAVRFLLLTARDLVTSSAQVARLVVSPRRAPRPAVVAVRVPDATPGQVLAIATAIGLTPGTVVVDTVADGRDMVLLVHTLDVDGVDEARAGALKVVGRVSAALPASPHHGVVPP